MNSAQLAAQFSNQSNLTISSLDPEIFGGSNVADIGWLGSRETQGTSTLPFFYFMIEYTSLGLEMILSIKCLRQSDFDLVGFCCV